MELSVPQLMHDVPFSEYEALVHDLGKNPNDDQLIAALIRDADWTKHGAQEAVRLARTYGTGVLRNALALAAALDIEDGQAEL